MKQGKSLEALGAELQRQRNARKEELLRIRESMEETRRYILNFRIQPETYGLYIKYPPGFEG